MCVCVTIYILKVEFACLLGNDGSAMGFSKGQTPAYTVVRIGRQDSINSAEMTLALQ